MPLWLMLLLLPMWAYYVMNEPKNGGPNYGWYMIPSVITIMALILVAGVSH